MSLKKYDELNEEERKKVFVMFSDQSTVDQYLYNFEGDKYIGRQYEPPKGVTKDGVPFGNVYREEEVKKSEEETEPTEPTKAKKPKKK